MLNRSIGNVTQWHQSSEGIQFSCEGFEGVISLYSSRIFRVRIIPHSLSPKGHSYAVTGLPKKEGWKVEEDEKTIRVLTEHGTLELQKSPFRVRLFDQNGKLLSADDESFGTSQIGEEITTYRSLMPGERFLGLGEKVGPVDRRGQAYTNYNTDKFGYSIEEDPLYLSTPFFIGVHDQGVYGLFLDNTFKSRFNFAASTDRFSWFSASNGEMDYYLIAGGTVEDIIREYTYLTGRIPLPPTWALGYQQCRYSYYPDDEVKTLAKTFRDKDIPADVIYLDIHYMDGYKAFTFDNERFPEPEKLHQELRKDGFRTVAIVDPGIKVQAGYGPYDRGIESDVFVKLPDGERYQGEVWPSWSHFPDFTDSKARKWWGKEMDFYRIAGVSGIWNDMNEPAAWGQCLPELLEFENEGEKTTHAEARNVYGMQMARATREGMQGYLQNERPFVLTRAGYSGVQRYSAVWTGDNVSSDDHMLLACRMLCSMGMTGIAFAGSDIGGFAGEADPALYARWISLGAFQPLARSHTQVNTRDAEPWSFGEEVEQIARNYIKLRYRLMPYIYTAFKKAQETGLPVMGSMAIYHAMDPKIYDPRFENQYYFGESLLVCPARSTEEHIAVYLPEGEWFDLYTDTKYVGGEEHLISAPLYKLPVFVRSGAIIPWMSQTHHAEDIHDGVLRLHVYMGGESSGNLYEDDGISLDHIEGKCSRRTWELKDDRLAISPSSGNFKSSYSSIELIFHGLHGQEVVTVNDHSMELNETEWRCVEPITGIDTFYADKGNELSTNVKVIQLTEIGEELKITF